MFLYRFELPSYYACFTFNVYNMFVEVGTYMYHSSGKMMPVERCDFDNILQFRTHVPPRRTILPHEVYAYMDGLYHVGACVYLQNKNTPWYKKVFNKLLTILRGAKA